MQDCLHEEVVNDALAGALFRKWDVEPFHQASPRRLIQLLAAGGPRNRHCSTCTVKPMLRIRDPVPFFDPLDPGSKKGKKNQDPNPGSSAISGHLSWGRFVARKTRTC
jgi:hypothetical protein